MCQTDKNDFSKHLQQKNKTKLSHFPSNKQTNDTYFTINIPKLTLGTIILDLSLALHILPFIIDINSTYFFYYLETEEEK